jgi:hypothetical protein
MRYWRDHLAIGALFVVFLLIVVLIALGVG